ncbi:5'-nucleotidase C-terminal domain-containing protein [Rhizobium sp. LjRoot254]|uniref:5'-nucleotidase C-terminal domain-containing protein n=1 Tax=Rhizobium sp. LjRoot254 TaxID=3342297 RepID=UPI003ECEB105
MNRFIRLAMLGASAFALSAGAAFADYELNILHINDFHSRIESINKFDSTCSAEDEGKGECFGGAARLLTAINETRAALAGKNVLLLNAGDNFQGSLFYTMYKGTVEAEMLNAMKFDAMTVGNHEFDDSEDALAPFLDKVQFPVVTANVVAGFSSKIKDKIKPSIVLDVGGQKIGIVGAVTNDTPEIATPGPNIMIGIDEQAIKDEVAKLKAEGVNKIIALTHVGYPRDLAVIAKIPDVDVVVGGHTHTLLSNTDKDAAGPYPTMVDNPGGYKVPVVQAGQYSKYLGDLNVVFDDAGVPKSAKGDPILVDAKFKPDAATVTRIAELAKPIEELKNKVIGESAEAIDGDRKNCRAKECAMGNLVAEAMLDRVKDQGVTIAIQNGGGVRASIDAGPVTMGEVLTVLPFQNSVATFQITGADLTAGLENGLSQLEEGAGRFAQVAGMKYSFDPKKPVGSRVISVEVMEGGKMVALDPAKTYSVVTNNYVRGGGDGYKIFAEKAKNAYDFGPSLEDVTAAYIGKHSPYKPFTDGRITIVDSAVPAAETAQSETGGDVKTPDLPAASTDIAKQPPAVTQDAATSKQTTTSEGAESASTQATTEQKYTIAKGDNYWDLAEKYYGDGAVWKKISEANPGLRPRYLPVGKEISVPAK